MEVFFHILKKSEEIQMNQVRRWIGFEERMDLIRDDQPKIGVCVLDSGIASHPDFGQRIVLFQDFVDGRMSLYDDYGHGTHIAGISSGNGMRSKGKYRGIAAHTNLVIGKVLNHQGDGRIEDFVKAIYWCITMQKKYHIRILNISIGLISRVEHELQAALLDAVEMAWDHGIVIVCAAGNNGPNRGSVTIPGTQPKVITVGSVDYRYNGCTPSDYSGRGPTEECVKKPEIYAPGSNIISCSNQDWYSQKTGTSMSVPVVTGAIALLLQQEPWLSPVDVKLRLYERAKRFSSDGNWGTIYLPSLLEKRQ